MKVGLYCIHYGLRRMFEDILQGHELITKDSPLDNVDVIISTVPHYDCLEYTHKIPVIVYATDPVYPHVKEHIDKGKYLVAGAEDCYPDRWIPQIDRYIPYAVNPQKYPKYEGSVNKVLVVNGKAHDRFKECSGENLDDFLKDFDWVHAKEPDIETFRNMYRDYKVLFYFSNSPYTIVMFEAMQVGIPIVAYTQNQVENESPDKNPIRKYLNYYSKDKSEVHALLSQRLKNPPQSEKYNFIDFNYVKSLWNNALYESTDEYMK